MSTLKQRRNMSFSLALFLLGLAATVLAAAGLARRIDQLLPELPSSVRRAYRQSRWD